MSLSSRRFNRVAISNVPHFRRDVQSFFPDRRLWMHVMMTVPWWDDTQDTTPGDSTTSYGSDYPLNLIAGSYQADPQMVEMMLSCGITGLQLLMGAGQIGHMGMVDMYVQQADATWSNLNAEELMQVALCVCDDATSIVSLIKEYDAYVTSGAHPSIARIDGRYVIFAYGSRAGKTPSDWAWIRAQVAAAGIAIVVIGDLDNQNPQSTFDIDSATLSQYFPYFEASWNFDWQSNRYPEQSFSWNSLMTTMSQYRQPYAGSIMPGYNRENMGQNGAYLNARGTRYLRSQFEQFERTNSRWLVAISWNDITEHHTIAPSSDWNRTRSDICAFYSSRLRNVPYPNPEPQLYVTTPQALFVGRPFQAEAMALNSGGVPVFVKIELFDSYGNLVDQFTPTPNNTVMSAAIPGGMSGDASIPATYIIGPEFGGKWVYGKATMYAADGVTVLQTVKSAPIIIYASGTEPASDMWAGSVPRTMYYSIPAYAALAEMPLLTMLASPTMSTTTAAVSLPSGGTMKFAEVLQNTRQVHLGFETTQFTTSVPLANGSTTKQGQTIIADAAGCYIARVVDAQNRVGYSDPYIV